MKACKRRIKTENNGFTFVEVILAIAILALIAVPVFNVIFESYRLNLQSRQMLAATDLSTMTMEYITKCTYDDFTYKNAANVDVTVNGVGTLYCKDGSKLRKTTTPLTYYIYPNSQYFSKGYHNVKSNDADGNLKKCESFFPDVVYNGYHFNVLVTVKTPDSSDKNTKEYNKLVKDVTISIYDYNLNDFGKSDDSVETDVKMQFNNSTLKYHDMISTVTTTIPNKKN